MISTETTTLEIKSTSSKSQSDKENEPKVSLLKVKMTPSKLGVPKDENMLHKLKSTIEKLLLENADLKKALNGERSAGRALRSQYDLMRKTEKTEFRKREESLEKQIKEVQRSSSALLNANADRHCSTDENVKVNIQTELLKKMNKDLNEKLLIVAEAEKRAVAELRARDDARASELSSAARLARVQTAKLLEELKTKDRKIDQLKRSHMKAPESLSGILHNGAANNTQTVGDKMSEIDRLHSLEAEINRLEGELQRRNCIINELKSSKIFNKQNIHTQEKPMVNRHRKELFIRDATSDVDSALSSGPNSLSPQPSPDLWETTNNEMELEAARKQIKELQKSLNESALETGAALSRLSRADAESTRLRDALRDARDHADLLEFRLLEIDDSAADKLGDTLQCIRDAISDADSGCVSPGNRLNGSASPEFNRGDSGFKSPVFRQTVDTRTLSTPTLKSTPLERRVSLENLSDGFHRNLKFEDLKHRLDLMLFNVNNEDDRNCIEQILSLLWDLQTFNNSMKDDYFSKATVRKLSDKYDKTDNFRDSESQCKTNKIIATISPYNQKSLFKDENTYSNAVPKTIQDLDATDDSYSSIKYPKILQESGIFEDINFDSKETQTDFQEICSGELSGDLTTEIERLNEIREQLEKSGAIISPNLVKDSLASGDSIRFILSDNHKKFYERRLKLLEEKVVFFESTKDRRDIKLAERLHRESVLESQIDDLNFELDKLQTKYAQLEEECCELDEAENDTRLHCQQLEIDYELVTAQLRDMEEQRDSAKQQSANMELLVSEYEDTNVRLLEQEQDLRDRLEAIENTMPALIFWNVFKIIEANPKFDFRAALMAKFSECPPPIQHNHNLLPLSDCKGQKTCKAMLAYQSMTDSTLDGDIVTLELHLQKLMEERIAVQTQHRSTEESLHSQILELERMLQDSKLASQRLEDETNMRINTLEQELALSKEKAKNPLSQALKQIEEGQTFDNECMLRLQQLIHSESELKNRIRELEHREMAYLETLTQADDMWAEMESGYKTQIKDKQTAEEKLREEMNQCVCDKEKWKTNCELLKQRVRELEEEENRLQEQLKIAQGQTNRLSEQNDYFKHKVDDLTAEAQSINLRSVTEMQTVQLELETTRQKSENLAEQLEDVHRQSKEVEEQLNLDIEEARKEIAGTCKELVELDLTNSELREEVETLEKQVVELNDVVKEQRAVFEEQLKSLSQELRRKSSEVEELAMKQNTNSLNALQEFQMENVHGEFGLVERGGKSDTPEKSCEWKHIGLRDKTEKRETLDNNRLNPCTCPSALNTLVQHLSKDIFEQMLKNINEKCSENLELLDINTQATLSVDEIAAIEDQLTRALSAIITNQTKLERSRISCWKPLPQIKELQDPGDKKS